MRGVVLDASVALAWCFPDETSELADGVLVALEGQSIVVPAIWGLEVANAILSGERGKRLKQPEVKTFLALLGHLAIVQDTQLGDVLPVARQYGLSAYDAAYLELSIRRNVPLATLDGKLRKAAQRAGIAIFSSGG